MNKYKKYLLEFNNKIGKISNILNFIGTFITIIALFISISALMDANRIYEMDMNGSKIDFNLRAKYVTNPSKYIKDIIYIEDATHQDEQHGYANIEYKNVELSKIYKLDSETVVKDRNLTLELKNIGTLPATNISILVEFNDIMLFPCDNLVNGFSGDADNFDTYEEYLEANTYIGYFIKGIDRNILQDPEISRYASISHNTLNALITSDEMILQPGEYIQLELGLDEYDIYIAGDNPKIVVSVLADKSLLNKKEYKLRYK